jgi:hypothetical protein
MFVGNENRPAGEGDSHTARMHVAERPHAQVLVVAPCGGWPLTFAEIAFRAAAPVTRQRKAHAICGISVTTHVRCQTELGVRYGDTVRGDFGL